MLAPLFMTDVEYQLQRSGIPYAERFVDEMDYNEFNETCLMPSLIAEVCILSLLMSLPLFLHFCTWWYSSVMIMSSWSYCQRPVDPSHLPLSVYAYGLDGFAREHPMGCNTKVMGYPFSEGTQAVNSLSSLPYLLFFCISQ